MIIKFDGIDGCGKSTLSRAVAERLSGRKYRVALVSEFASPVKYSTGSAEPLPITSMLIREAVLDPSFDCDDVERQLMLHFLSRRKNRVDLPHLDRLHDYVLVDRSTLSNYAYAAAVDQKLAALSDIAVGDIEKASHIFWIDTPIETCMRRLSDRSGDVVERKGRPYFEQVHYWFGKVAAVQGATRILDGKCEVSALVQRVLTILEEVGPSD